MTDRAIATKLALKAMEESESISSIEDRTRLQKLIYLAQQVGVPLGYYFSWYLRGPYSSPLAKDYYNFPTDAEVSSRQLLPELKERLQCVKAAVRDERRNQTPLSKSQWLELLASVHYLDKVSKLDPNSVAAKMQREKPLLAPHVAIARNVISDHIEPKASEALQ